MFTSHLPDDIDYRVNFSDFSKRHFIKRFEKNHKGKQWLITYKSIIAQLKRVHAIQLSQQVDELKSAEDCMLFKYDFAIAQTHISAKASGNRCIIFLDIKTQTQTILLMYAKTDLPKNQQETAFINKIIVNEFPVFWQRLNSKSITDPTQNQS